MDKSAALIFNEIESNYNNYKNLAQKTVLKPKVLTNEMYGSQWFVAGGKTQIAHFIQDAGAEYIFGDNTDQNLLPKVSKKSLLKQKMHNFG
jgi:iron complex transport system substrate-binding protein